MNIPYLQPVILVAAVVKTGSQRLPRGLNRHRSETWVQKKKKTQLIKYRNHYSRCLLFPINLRRSVTTQVPQCPSPQGRTNLTQVCSWGSPSTPLSDPLLSASPHSAELSLGTGSRPRPRRAVLDTLHFTKASL